MPLMAKAMEGTFSSSLAVMGILSCSRDGYPKAVDDVGVHVLPAGTPDAPDTDRSACTTAE